MNRRSFLINSTTICALLPVFGRATALTYMKRRNKYFLNPYFLDKVKNSLVPIAGKSWKINSVELPVEPQFDRMTAIFRPVIDFAGQSMIKGSRPVIISGDCCISLAVIRAFQKSGIRPTMIYFDAHGDFNTPKTSPSGFIGGMPLAMLMGLGDQTLMKLLSIQPLNPNQVILLDGRNLDPGEDKAVNDSGIFHYTDPGRLRDHNFGGNPVYVHVDADVINPNDAPAVLYPAAGGPRANELVNLFSFLSSHLDVRAVSMGAWEPHLDTNNSTERICLKMLAKLCEN